MPNRLLAPTLNPIGEIQLESPEKLVFENGLHVFVFRAPDQELIKAEFVFQNVFEAIENPIRNSALSSMLKEGTSQMTSAQIANKIDYYGAYLVPEFSFDHNALTLYSLKKHVHEVLPVVHDVLSDAQIPQQELDTYIRNNKQSLQISLEKTDFVARRTFYQQVFGETRYGRPVSDQLLSALTRDDLLKLYKQQIQPKQATLFLSGDITDDILELFRSYFGTDWKHEVEVENLPFVAKPSGLFDVQLFEKPGALQSSVRLGKQSLRRSHPDFVALQFVNTLFGGYFGSRLMSNIREEKGYTYSIGSAIANLGHAGFMTIATDVGTKNTEDTLKQIELEIIRLQQDKVSMEELDLVRNYLLGSLLGSLESIFSHVDKFKSVYFAGLDLTYYHRYTETIKGMTADQVMDISQKYLNYDDMYKIVVGSFESA